MRGAQQQPEDVKPRGERIAWVFFLFTCIQLAFLRPYVVIIPGERANLFSALLCALSLCLTLIFVSGKGRWWRSCEVWLSLTLLVLVFLSGILSESPRTSSIRGFTITAAGLGGFWCARLLLQEESRRIFFAGFCSLLLLAMSVLAIAGFAASGEVFRFVDVHWHPVGAKLLLLSFGPLALMGFGSGRARLAGIALLGLGFAGLLLLAKHHGMESVLLIPPGLLAAAVCLRRWSRPQLAAMLLLAFVASMSLFNQVHRRGESLARDHQSVAYRVENIFFSWEIATRHPWLGIGLWAPRDSYLEKHEIRYPSLSRETFAQWTQELRTSENSVLTLLADLGFPAVILYGTGVSILFWRLLRKTVAGDSVHPFHPLVLLLPLTAEAFHLQVCDALFQPQINWFFHVLLGMIPVSKQAARAAEKNWRPVLLKIAALVLCVLLGALLGLTLPRGTVLDYLL